MRRLVDRLLGAGSSAGSGAAMLSLAAATGMVVGARSVVALELPGVRSLLGLPSLPREPMAVLWTARVAWPDQLQDAALTRVAALTAALLLAAASVAILNTLVLLLEAGAERRREIAIRAAVGAKPSDLGRLLLRSVRRLVAFALTLGVLLGLTAGGALRAAWPGELGAVGLGSAGATLLPALLVLASISALSYMRVAVRVGGGPGLAEALASGGRTTADRGEAFQRRALSAVQMGGAGAVALGTLALAMAVDGAAPGSEGGDQAVAVAVTAPPSADGPVWAALLASIGEIPGLEAESLATPGALVGLGVRDNATAQCGACVRGGLPLPFWGARADHHAVAPGFFEAAGIRILGGRDFAAEDGAGAKRVALVNRTFATTSFENGDPLGRLVRLGRGMDAWYEVVGVVEDRQIEAVGGDDLARAAVYVSAFQQPPRHGDVLLRGDDVAVATAVAVLRAAGYAPGVPRSLDEERRRAAAPLRWAARLSLVLGALTLALAVHGSHATALQVTRRRVRELAIRRVLGGTDGRLLVHVMSGSAKGALWGAALATFFGALLIGLLRRAVGGIPAPGPGAYVAVTALLVGTALLASTRAAREALAVEPGAVVE